MQRLVLYAGSAAAIALAVWLVTGTPREFGTSLGRPAAEPSLTDSGTAESGIAKSGAAESGIVDSGIVESAGSSAGAVAQPGAGARAASPHGGDPRAGGASAAGGADWDAAGAPGPDAPGPAPSDEQRVVRAPGEQAPPAPEDTRDAPESAGGIPMGGIPIGTAQAPTPSGADPGAQDDPSPRNQTASDDSPPALASDPGSTSAEDAPSEPPEVLSPSEIDRRVLAALPDGSLPPEQLEPAREALAEAILNKSTQAASWATQANY